MCVFFLCLSSPFQVVKTSIVFSSIFSGRLYLGKTAILTQNQFTKKLMLFFSGGKSKKKVDTKILHYPLTRFLLLFFFLNDLMVQLFFYRNKFVSCRIQKLMYDNF